MSNPRERLEHEQVYQPAEDSQLLATTVTDRISPTDRVLEIGTGSGYVASQIVEKTGATVVATDINPHACRSAADKQIEVVRTDIADAIKGQFDVVVCNPPYLPTDPDDEFDDWMEYALSGGPDGRALVNPLLEELPRLLTDDGRAYLLVSTLTGIDAITERAAEFDLLVETIAEEPVPFETLTVLKITQKH
ncbi:HemK2/MTQ2 family protein methyltransferase [Halocatena halophila]|uniref:HemK2/MTQ2 family protein methyltransferase n=1 Tax=Halocatena halophila TaxID=2814576 RepID=UPI002ED6BF6A